MSTHNNVPDSPTIAKSGAGPGGVPISAGAPPVHRVVWVVDVATDDPVAWVAEHLPRYGPGVRNIRSTVRRMDGPGTVNNGTTNERTPA